MCSIALRMPGKFITFEGGEGSGKSTQIALLAKAFTDAGVDYVQTREPGGTAGAEAIRGLLVSGAADRWDPVAETLLFHAARLDHVEKLIRPALAKGAHVICDRFADSTLVYQGVGKGLPADYVQALHRLTLGNFMPDLTIMLDIDPAEGLTRAHARRGDETRFESLGLEFHQRVRAGFMAVAAREPQRCVRIDAGQNAEQVHAQVMAVVSQRLGIA